jgi:hypothetical protein
MLRFADGPLSRGPGCSRREWLRIGGLAGLNWALPGLVPRRATASDAETPKSPGFGRAKAVIVVFASGGQSQFETWDPKPLAPLEIRGEFDSIETAVPGLRLCEHLPQVARVADKFTVVRCMSHEDLDHGTAAYLTLTGRYHRVRSGNPLPSETDQPCYSAVLQRVRPSREFVHTAVHLNGPALVPLIPGPGQFGGLLGKKYDAFTLGDVSRGEVTVPGLDPQPELPAVRLEARQSLLSTIDRHQLGLERNRALLDADVLRQQAFAMLSEPQTRDAFRLSDEPDAVRDRYGRNRSGQACILARRLVGAGVPLVTVIWSHTNRGQDLAFDDVDEWGWDTHNDIFFGLKERLLPRFDQGFSALLEDLDQRGMLDETLVVCLGEFGRAPLVAVERKFAGSSPGRKHWASVYSIVLAGAGVTRGAIVGASDSRGAYPTGERYAPWDVIATIFSALGIDPQTEYTTPQGQAMRVCDGRPIDALYVG